MFRAVTVADKREASGSRPDACSSLLAVTVGLMVVEVLLSLVSVQVH